MLTDPPREVKFTTPTGVEIINLHKGFGEHVLNISAESYSEISCSSVIITWESPTQGNILSCQAAGKEDHANSFAMTVFHLIKIKINYSM